MPRVARLAQTASRTPIVWRDRAAGGCESGKSGSQVDLDELIAGITEDNKHEFIAFGEPVGKEIW